MADKKVEAATAGPGEKRAAARPQLLKASESGDPAVQYLAAVRNTAAQNGDDEQASWANAELGRLGFE